MKSCVLLPILSLMWLCWSLAPLVSAQMGTPLKERVPATGRFASLPASETGINLTHQFPKSAPFALMTDQYSGCGVCLGDVDGDGLTDVYITNYSQGNRLYRNRGAWRFEDITESAGVGGDGHWCAGPCFADVDNDGDLDLHVSVFDAPNLFYLNDGNGVFTEAAKAHGLDYAGASVMMSFADYDADGDLDGYLVTHRMPLAKEAVPPRSSKEAIDRGIVRVEEVNGKRQAVLNPGYEELFVTMDKGEGRIELATAGSADVLYQNDGQGKFKNVSKNAGITARDIGLAATWWDANADGYPDLYVSNDYKGPDHFYLNQKDGTFRDVIRTALPHIPWLSMGSDFSDVNGDGRMDFLATDMAARTHYEQKASMGNMAKDRWFLTGSNPRQMMRNALYLNTGTERFQEAAFLTGLAQTDWTWSPKFGDLDNDGREDLFVTNGMSRAFMNSDLANKMPSNWRSDAWADTPVLRQKNLAFRNMSELDFQSYGEAWGLDQLAASYGGALGDLDQDGDLDLVVMNFDAPVSVLRNDVSDANASVIALQGRLANRFGIGAELRLTTEKGVQVKQLATARGFMSANEPILHFGLGSATEIDEIIVRWPGGGESAYRDLPVNQRLTLQEPETLAKTTSVKRAPSFQEVRLPLMPEPHRERPFDDYERQPLLPMQHSLLGPGLALGDVNGDGMDDFYVGGAAGQSGQLVIVAQKMRIATKPFDQHAKHEDTGALFIDADSDGDLDLVVVSGGVECDPNSDQLLDRLYLNDGQGNFTPSQFSTVRASGSAIAAADVDHDGDVDLFIGTRLIPGQYPQAAASQLLINDGGKWQAKPMKVGMVSAVLWSDINADGWVDLLVASDWGPVRCWINREGSLTETTDSAGLSTLTGWWRGLASGDLDNDGDMDFVATNIGLNTKYHASSKSPLYLYYGDFDGTGRKRIIEASYEHDVLYPDRGRSCSTAAIPSLKSKFRTYHQFAKATLTEIYGTKLNTAERLSATTLASGAFLNDGSGKFTYKPLPKIAQVAPGHGVVILDTNSDGKCDVYLVHNDHSPQPETGRFDGGVSQLLLGRGDGSFYPVPLDESGLLVSGDARALGLTDFNRDGAFDFLVTRSNGAMQVFQNKNPGKSRIIRLKGPKGNPQGIGARLLVTDVSGKMHVAEIASGHSYLTQSSAGVAFTVMPGQELTTAEVWWPNGKHTKHLLNAGESTSVLTP